MSAEHTFSKLKALDAVLWIAYHSYSFSAFFKKQHKNIFYNIGEKPAVVAELFSALSFNLSFNSRGGWGFKTRHIFLSLQFEKFLSFAHAPWSRICTWAVTLLLVRSYMIPFAHVCKGKFAFVSIQLRQDRCRYASYLYGTITLNWALDWT